jgi:hypothetical protein
MKKVATQSSLLYNKYAASKATDGVETNFSHTTGSNASWEVELGQDYSIESLGIKNRWCEDKDDAPGCLCRLSNTKDAEGSVIKSIDTGDTCGRLELKYDFSHAFGSEVSVL